MFNEDNELYEALFDQKLPSFDADEAFDIERSTRAVIAEMDRWGRLDEELDERARNVVLSGWAFAVTVPEFARAALEPMARKHPAVATWLGLIENRDAEVEDHDDVGDESSPPTESVLPIDVEDASSPSLVPLTGVAFPPAHLDDAFIQGTVGLLQEIGTRQETLVKAISEGRYSEFDGLHAALDRARHGLSERLAQRAAELHAPSPLPEPSPHMLATDAGWHEYIATLRAALADATNKSQQRVDTARADYLLELQQLSLPPPPDIDDVSSLDQLESLRERDLSRVREARFRRSLRDKEGRESARSEVEAPRRVLIYMEEAHRPDVDPGRVLEWLEPEAPEAYADRSASARDLVSIAHGWIRRGRSVPKGTWALIASLDREALIEALRDPDFAMSLLRADPSTTRGPELVRIVATDAVNVHAVAQRFIRLVTAADTELGGRIRILSELVGEEPTDTRAVIELLRSLVSAGRLDALWLTVDALVRAGHLTVLEELPLNLRPSLLAFLAERAIGDGSYHSVLGELVENSDWVGNDLDALTVLLFLAVRSDKGRVVLFRHPHDIPRLQQVRPWLFNSWLKPRLERVPSRLNDRELIDMWRRGHEAVVEWGHEILKPTCYQAWRYATDYQRHVRARLEDYFAEVTNGGQVTITPEEMIEEIERDCHLPVMKQPALGLICTHIEEQLSRASTVAASMGRCAASVGDLRRSATPPDRQALEAEASEDRNRGAIATIYRYALRGTP